MLKPVEEKTRVCVFCSLNIREYAEVLQYRSFDEHLTCRLSLHGYDAKVLVLSSAVPMKPEESQRLVTIIRQLRCAELSQLWFFGSDLTRHVIYVHRRAHKDIRILNRSRRGSSLYTYLELFKERINAWT